MESSIGVNLRVTAHSNQGGRKYMEDMFCVAYQPTTDDKDLLYAYFGIFDGHGGREAAIYAKQHLMDHIVSQKNFWAEDDRLILKAIRDGFIATHYAMWKELGMQKFYMNSGWTWLDMQQCCNCSVCTRSFISQHGHTWTVVGHICQK